jgi:hypothetical protein
MTKENARTLSQVFLVLSILSILFVCGNCCANSQKGEYGPEEFYDKGGGEVGYGAKYYNSSTDQSMLVAVIGGTLFLAFSISSAIFSSKAKQLETGQGEQPPVDNLSLAVFCPICDNKCSRRAVSCPKCGHPIYSGFGR